MDRGGQEIAGGVRALPVGQRSETLLEAQGHGGRHGRGERAWGEHVEARSLGVSNLAGVVAWRAGCVGEACGGWLSLGGVSG